MSGVRAEEAWRGCVNPALGYGMHSRIVVSNINDALFFTLYLSLPLPLHRLFTSTGSKSPREEARDIF